MKPKWMLIGFALGVVSLVVMATTWFPEGNRPLQSDNSQKSLQKINDLLYGGGAGLLVQATVTATTDTNGNLHSYGPPGSTTAITDGAPFPVKDTNILAELVTIRQTQTNNPATNNVHITDAPTGTTEANAVITTNQFTTALSNLVWQMIYHNTNGDNLIGNVFNPAVTNDAATGLYVRPSTNQVSFSGNFTNLLNNVTNAGVAGQVAWSATNSVFSVNGGDGLLQGIKLLVATNRDHTILCFNRVVTAQTSGSAVSLTSADMQYCVGKWSTTNTARWEAPTLVGTNYLYNIDCLATPIKNSDSSKNIMFVGLYLDTKSNYVANTSQIMFNMLLNQ